MPGILRFFADPVMRMLELRREFGPLVAVAEHKSALVCAFGAELNRQILSNPGSFPNDTEVPVRVPAGSAIETFCQALTFMNGDAHRRVRRMLMPVFQKSVLDSYAAQIVEITSGCLDEWPAGQTHDVLPLIRKITADIAMRCIFGIDEREHADRIKMLEHRTSNSVFSPWAIALPLRIPGTPYWELYDACEQMQAELIALIQRNREREQGRRDVLSLMMAANDQGESFSDRELVGNLNTLFTAGYQTSAMTLVWTLVLLDRHPQILAALVEELDTVLGDAPPQVEQLAKLPLLDRVIKESMRLLPVTPMMFLRVCANPATLAGFELPSGANLVISPLVTHRDADLYPEPQRFRPARWESLDPSTYAYMPFGAGPRTCIGMGFATMSTRLVLASILQRQRLSIDGDLEIKQKIRGLVMEPERALPMTIHRQDRQFARGRGQLRGHISALVDLDS